MEGQIRDNCTRDIDKLGNICGVYLSNFEGSKDTIALNLSYFMQNYLNLHAQFSVFAWLVQHRHEESNSVLWDFLLQSEKRKEN